MQAALQGLARANLQLQASQLPLPQGSKRRDLVVVNKKELEQERSKYLKI